VAEWIWPVKWLYERTAEWIEGGGGGVDAEWVRQSETK